MMPNLVVEYLIYLAVPFLLGLVFTPLVRGIALRSGFVSYPRHDRWHRNPTALLGGVAIYLSFLLSAFLFGLVNRFSAGLILGATFLFAVGIFDDRYGFPPYFKLFAQIIAGSIAILSGTIIGLPVNQIFSIPLTLLWIVGVTNAFNLLDNIDGLAAGIASICAIMLFLSFLDAVSSPVIFILLILCGAALGFLPYNFNPAKIFMGDSGSLFLGFSLAVISISSTTRHLSNLFLTIAIPVLVLVVPIFDTVFVMIIRKIQGRKIFEGGKDHTSHHLVTLGLSPRRAVFLLYLISFIFGLIGTLYARINLFVISVISFCCIVVLIYFGVFLFEGISAAKKPMQPLRQVEVAGNQLILNRVFLHKRRIAEVLLDFVFVCIAYYGAYFLRFEANLLGANLSLIRQSLLLVILVKMGVFFAFGLYRGTWRYISIPDFLTIFKVVSLGSIIAVLLLTFLFRFKEYSRAVFFLDWLLLLVLITGSRFLFRIIGEFFSKANLEAKKVFIFGAGDTGEMVIREIKRNKSLNYQPVGFIDDDIRKVGNKIQGVSVLGGRDKFRELIVQHQVKEIIIAIPSLSHEDMSMVTTVCGDCGIKFKRVKRLFEEEGDGGVGKN